MIAKHHRDLIIGTVNIILYTVLVHVLNFIESSNKSNFALTMSIKIIAMLYSPDINFIHQLPYIFLGQSIPSLIPIYSPPNTSKLIIFSFIHSQWPNSLSSLLSWLSLVLPPLMPTRPMLLLPCGLPGRPKTRRLTLPLKNSPDSVSSLKTSTRSKDSMLNPLTLNMPSTSSLT